MAPVCRESAELRTPPPGCVRPWRVAELCHAVTQWPSWHAMVKDGLTVKRQEKKPPVAPEVAEFRQQTRRTATLYRKLNPADLAVKDLEALEQLRDEIDRLLSEA
jgi:hypothetical protein